MVFGTPEYDELLLDIINKELRHSLYKTTVEIADKMRIHIYGDKPTEILKRVRPREPEEIKKYREENYEPTTKATASKALSIVGKIFNPALFKIQWKKQTANGQKLADYTLQYFPRYNSIIKFLSEAGLKKTIADPNGVFVIRPREVPVTDLQMVEPEIKVYGSPAIWYKDEDHYLIHIKTEDVQRGKRYHFEYYDKMTIIDFSVMAINQKQLEVRIKLEYQHRFGELPLWYLSGETETTDNGEEYYISFFEPAVPFWNKAVIHESDLDAAFIMHLHPQKVVAAEECDFQFDDQRCQNGWIQNPDGKPRQCPSCHGTGKKIAVGPFGVHMVKQEKLEYGMQMTAPVQYVTVPTDPTKLLKERVDEQHVKGLEALNMDVIDKVGENQSGIAKVIDRGELYDFLYKIADVMFDVDLQNIYYFFNRYMFGVQDSNPGRNLASNLPEILKPVMFDLSSASEMTAEYAVAKQASVNPEYLRQKQIAIAIKEYAGSPDLQRKVVTMLELDPLPEITPTDMEVKLALGTISKRDAVIHDNMGSFVDKASADKEGFYLLTKAEKLEIIQKLADEFISANQVKLNVEEDDAEGADDANRRAVA
jgi:hypothetical protein